MISSTIIYDAEGESKAPTLVTETCATWDDMIRRRLDDVFYAETEGLSARSHSVVMQCKPEVRRLHEISIYLYRSGKI